LYHFDITLELQQNLLKVKSTFTISNLLVQYLLTLKPKSWTTRREFFHYYRDWLPQQWKIIPIDYHNHFSSHNLLSITFICVALMWPEEW